jgi:hypothetical protein
MEQMKKLFCFLILFVSLCAFSQDSSQLKPTVLIQARDCEVICWFLKNNILPQERFEDLDSVLKSKFRPASNAPTAATNVTIDGTKAGAWEELYKVIKTDLYCIAGGTTERVEQSLISAGHTWLTSRVVAFAAIYPNGWTDIRRVPGRKYLKKE